MSVSFISITKNDYKWILQLYIHLKFLHFYRRNLDLFLFGVPIFTYIQSLEELVRTYIFINMSKHGLINLLDIFIVFAYID